MAQSCSCPKSHQKVAPSRSANISTNSTDTPAPPQYGKIRLTNPFGILLEHIYQLKTMSIAALIEVVQCPCGGTEVLNRICGPDDRIARSSK